MIVIPSAKQSIITSRCTYFSLSVNWSFVILRVVMGENLVNALASSFLIGSSFLQVTRTTIIPWTSSKFGQIGPRTAELAALERLETSTCIKVWMSLNFNQI